MSEMTIEHESGVRSGHVGRAVGRDAGRAGPERGHAADRRGRLAAAADQEGAGVRPGRRDHRPSRLWQARSGREEQRQQPQRHPVQDRADRRRAGRGQGAPRRGGQFRAADRQETAAAADRRGRDGAVAVRERPHPRGDLRAPGRGLRRRGLQADHLHDHRPGDGEHGRMVQPAARPRLSRFVRGRHQRQDPGREGRQPARSTSSWPSRPRATATSSASGPATAARARNTGCRSSPSSRTAAWTMC